MNSEPKDHQSDKPAAEYGTSERRELIRKLGKFAVYAAPFTVLAKNSKAASASGPNTSGRSR